MMVAVGVIFFSPIAACVALGQAKKRAANKASLGMLACLQWGFTLYYLFLAVLIIFPMLARAK